MKLNIGCGEFYARGWVNLDLHDDWPAGPRPDIVGSALALPFPDGACERVFAAHVLEHLYFDEVAAALREMRRVLADDGELMVVGPDITGASALDRPALLAGAGRWPGDDHRWVSSANRALAVIRSVFPGAIPVAIAGVGERWPLVSRARQQFAVLAKRAQTMRVVLPYTIPHEETCRALAESGWAWEARELIEDDAYWRLLNELWAFGAPFIIVEQDIVLRAGALPELASCTAEWCGWSYPYLGGRYAGLGCAKFSAALIARVPEALQTVATRSDAQHPPRHWCRLDAWLQEALKAAGAELHVHEPPLRHCRADSDRRPSHGCC